MKRILVLFAVALTGFLYPAAAHAQFIRDNAFHLPMIGGEVTFIQNDTVTGLASDQFLPIAKSWVQQNYPGAKFTKEAAKDNTLQASVSFKIDDQHIQAPLYYRGTLHIHWKDEVIQVKLDDLSYTPGHPKGKSKKNTGSTNVSFQVKQQVLAGTDQRYPHTWDSLQEYANALLQDFKKNLETTVRDQL